MHLYHLWLLPEFSTFFWKKYLSNHQNCHKILQKSENLDQPSQKILLKNISKQKINHKNLSQTHRYYGFKLRLVRDSIRFPLKIIEVKLEFITKFTGRLNRPKQVNR